jgi:hypothetical protein
MNGIVTSVKLKGQGAILDALRIINGEKFEFNDS